MNETYLNAAKWRNTESVMLSEKNKKARIDKFIEIESRLVSEGWGGGNGSDYIMGLGFLFI